MNVMQQSSKAHDRSLGDWFVYIDKGMIKLPRFQRMGLWHLGRIEIVVFTVARLPHVAVQWARNTETVSA
ncbi:hypothetical protein [Halorhodospira halochloris]|uniref:hypothetical protein n=1 Tax=Halorhodospira halochloris TaxID=1052 RepID=UPI001EE8ED88|nr:hypothetical protein [Halorhodospira halochloris]MCG5549213.1 hypothetical protein [Halorhodospira halochloris]